LQRAWQFAGSAFVVLFVLWAHQSWQLSLTNALGPGPGFFPFWLSVIGCALSIALVALARRASDSPEPPEAEVDWPRGRVLLQILVVLGALAGVAASLESLGFQIVMAAFCLVVLPALGARNWWVIIIFAVAASLGVHAVFSDLLKVPLPAGLLEP
jgi:putative tricarboxylic transport membrane protein